MTPNALAVPAWMVNRITYWATCCRFRHCSDYPIPCIFPQLFTHPNSRVRPTVSLAAEQFN